MFPALGIRYGDDIYLLNQPQIQRHHAPFAEYSDQIKDIGVVSGIMIYF